MAERRCEMCEYYMENWAVSSGLAGAGRCTWPVPDHVPVWVKAGPRDVSAKAGKECETWQPKTT